MTEKLTAEDWENFWEYLQAEANDTDHWWLDSWLDTQLDDWKESPAHSCGCKRTHVEYIQSKTQHHYLQYIYRCSMCNDIVKVISNKDAIKQLVNDGNVRVSDIKVLKAELGLI